ncbi:MAG TPA: class I SAM-dependent methyltransferase [Candidatus Binataceae bacterium]|nr:class I SAM-dependent methyltransferase [Candidatus Binataceae bacterium]
MEKNPYLQLQNADPLEREQLYEQAYNRGAGDAAPDPAAIPEWNARRRRRLKLYRRVMGAEARAVLEIGCGTGDLTCALARDTPRVVAIDLSSRELKLAQLRAARYPELTGRIEFLRMNAVRLELAEASFDFAVSTSMIEHLHPDDVDRHLREVWRVLKPSGRYLVWCPNRLGHHKDRPFHLCMMSHRELRARMLAAGFRSFQSPLMKGAPMVGTQFKVAMESAMSALRIPILWSHLGVRNVMIVAAK